MRCRMRSCCCGGRLLKRCKRSRNICCRSGGKAAELGIVIQRLLLLIGRKIFVAAQPLSGVIARTCRRAWRSSRLCWRSQRGDSGRGTADGERHHECGNRRHRLRVMDLSCNTLFWFSGMLWTVFTNALHW